MIRSSNNRASDIRQRRRPIHHRYAVLRNYRISHVPIDHPGPDRHSRIDLTRPHPDDGEIGITSRRNRHEVHPTQAISVGIISRVEVNPIEILREGPSYTIDTVEAVAQNYEGDTIVLIVGTDAYEKIDLWHRAEELKKMVEFVVIDRPEFPGQHNTSVDAIAVSATDIRAHKSDAVPAAVAAYIKEHNLYASK